MKFKEYMSELRSLNLQKDQYAIFGSGPMAVRNLRDSKDLDVIAKKELWCNLSKRYLSQDRVISIGKIDIYNDWSEPFTGKIEELIDDADIIGSIRFVKLEHVLTWKSARNKEKDIKDVELIKEYLEKG